MLVEASFGVSFESLVSLSVVFHDLFRCQSRILQALHVARVWEQAETLVLELLAQLDKHIQVLLVEV